MNNKVRRIAITKLPEEPNFTATYNSMSMHDLLKLGVTHELGHALCNERNEKKADAYAEQLGRGEASSAKVHGEFGAAAGELMTCVVDVQRTLNFVHLAS
jgi:hypothetical protein